MSSIPTDSATGSPPRARRGARVTSPGSAGRAALVAPPVTRAAPLDREAGPVPAGRSSLPDPVCMEPAGSGIKPPPPVGECSRDGGRTTPRRGRGSTPAGAGLDADGTAPAGPRTFTIALPAGLELLNANDRGHWTRRRRVTATLREAATWLARQQRIPPLSRARITAVYEPPDRRRRDAPNWYPSFKAAIDGLSGRGGAYQMIPAPDVTALEMTCGSGALAGRIVLHLTEVAATGGDAA